MLMKSIRGTETIFRLVLVLNRQQKLLCKNTGNFVVNRKNPSSVAQSKITVRKDFNKK